MKKLKKFYQFTEIWFFSFWFFFFGLALFMKNWSYENITNFLFNFLYFPFVFFWIAYWLIALRFYLDKEKNDLLDNFILFLWAGFFCFVIFINFVYPNLI